MFKYPYVELSAGIRTQRQGGEELFPSYCPGFFLPWPVACPARLDPFRFQMVRNSSVTTPNPGT